MENLESIDQDMAASLEWAVAEIKRIQSAARTGKAIVKPRWPVLILRTPKVRSLFSISFCCPSDFDFETESTCRAGLVPRPSTASILRVPSAPIKSHFRMQSLIMKSSRLFRLGLTRTRWTGSSILRPESPQKALCVLSLLNRLSVLDNAKKRTGTILHLSLQSGRSWASKRGHRRVA